jgi:hypothetical protein
MPGIVTQIAKRSRQFAFLSGKATPFSAVRPGSPQKARLSTRDAIDAVVTRL